MSFPHTTSRPLNSFWNTCWPKYNPNQNQSNKSKIESNRIKINQIDQNPIKSDQNQLLAANRRIERSATGSSSWKQIFPNQYGDHLSVPRFQSEHVKFLLLSIAYSYVPWVWKPKYQQFLYSFRKINTILTIAYLPGYQPIVRTVYHAT